MATLLVPSFGATRKSSIFLSRQIFHIAVFKLACFIFRLCCFLFSLSNSMFSREHLSGLAVYSRAQVEGAWSIPTIHPMNFLTFRGSFWLSLIDGNVTQQQLSQCFSSCNWLNVDCLSLVYLFSPVRLGTMKVFRSICSTEGIFLGAQISLESPQFISIRLNKHLCVQRPVDSEHSVQSPTVLLRRPTSRTFTLLSFNSHWTTLVIFLCK